MCARYGCHIGLRSNLDELKALRELKELKELKEHLGMTFAALCSENLYMLSILHGFRRV
jgi:hypothetical protein